MNLFTYSHRLSARLFAGIAMVALILTLAPLQQASAQTQEPELECLERNILSNASFENPALATTTAGVNIHGDGLWIILNSIPGWDGVVELWNNMFDGAFHGDQNLELDVTAPSTISQDVDTTIGATYKLSFAFAPRSNTQATDNAIEARVNGERLIDAAAVGGSWVTYSATFVADTESTEISFVDMGTGTDGSGTLLDDTELCLVVAAPDVDADGEPDATDNCPNIANPNQADDDGDGVEMCDTPDTVLGCMDPLATNYDDEATEDDGSCSYQCVISSDTTTTVNGIPSILTFVHPVWTKTLEAGSAEWIWAADAGQFATFTKTFYVNDAPTGASLTIAVDNLYSATLNGTPLTCDGASGNNHSSVDTCSAPVTQGLNTLVVSAENIGGPNTADLNNPAGAIFELTVNGSLCSPVIENPSSITIVKEVANETITDWSFDFASEAGGNFTLTDEAPSVTFDYLADGNYGFTETLPTGWASPVVECSSEGMSYGDVGGEFDLALAAGEDVTCTVTNRQTQIPGPDLYLIYGYVWHDDNRNGNWEGRFEEGGDNTEEELAGRIIRATKGTTTVETVTGENGRYEFNVPAGTWVITEELPSGWIQTGVESHTVTVPAPQPEEEEEDEGPVSMILNLIIPTAHAQVALPEYNFGNDRRSSGGGGGRSLSDNDDDEDGEVLGDSDDAEPLPLVLGEQVDAVPLGAADTGTGSTAPVALDFLTIAPAAFIRRK